MKKRYVVLVATAATVAIAIPITIAFLFFGSVIADVQATPVTIVNDYPGFARISGNCADQPLDLESGDSAQILVRRGGTSACGVYLGYSYSYVGCVAFDSSSTASTVQASRLVDKEVDEKACQARQS